jgi:hypothetical protein
MHLPIPLQRFSLVLTASLALLELHCGSSTPTPSTTPPSGGCTSLGCVDGLQIEMSPNASWPAGVYRFVIVADGEQTVCEGSLPLRACDQGPSLSCTGGGVMIGESGCALAAAQHGFSDIHLQAGPANVTVTIERDGAEMVRKTFTPTYRDAMPNGPDCPPVCRQASDQFALP